MKKELTKLLVMSVLAIVLSSLVTIVLDFTRATTTPQMSLHALNNGMVEAQMASNFASSITTITYILCMLITWCLVGKQSIKTYTTYKNLSNQPNRKDT